MKLDRFNKLVKLIGAHDLDGLAINPGPSLTYLTGLHFHLMERPTVMLITRSGEAALIIPELEKGKITQETPNFHLVTYEDDPTTWPKAFSKAVECLNLAEGRIGVEPNQLRFLELSYLQDAAPGLECVDGSQAFTALRLTKDEGELQKMKTAADIAQKALLATLQVIRIGMTEKNIANELVVQLLRAGSDPHIPFQPIVALGENSANPHAVPTERALQKGDLLLIDWGASYEGYFSDITRTFTMGDVDPELLRIGKIVAEANRAGRAAGRQGSAAGDVDRAARSVITSAGYGDAFIHRTGHGLGMEAHEPPYIFAENPMLLTVGMTFTIEPGIYLPGKGGVRIEDDVVVTATGLDSLTDLPRQMLPLEQFMS
jgi:Xaa-Pro dipeptidase